jgi:predicted nucleic acid-binding Zn ribbon protein
MTRRDEPIPLDEAMAAVGRDLGMPSASARDVVDATWATLAGPALAPHTRVRNVRHGECTIEVDGPAFATQVRYLADELARRCHDPGGTPILSTVRVVVARP